MRGDSANPCSHPDPRRRALARVGSRRRVLDPDSLTRRVRRMTGIAPFVRLKTPRSVWEPSLSACQLNNFRVLL